MVACTGAERSCHFTITPGVFRECLAKAGLAMKRNVPIKRKTFSVVLIRTPMALQQKHLTCPLVAVVLSPFLWPAGDGDDSAEDHAARANAKPKHRALRHRSHVLGPAEKQSEQSKRRDRNSETDQSFAGHGGGFRGPFEYVHAGPRIGGCAPNAINPHPLSGSRPRASLTKAMFPRILCVVTVSASLVYAADSPSPSPTSVPPTEPSIKQLLEVAQAHKLVDSVMAQMDSLL